MLENLALSNTSFYIILATVAAFILLGGLYVYNHAAGAARPVNISPDSVEKCRVGGFRRVVVLINPASGAGAAAKIFKSVEPLLKEAGMEVTAHETTSRGHACSIANQKISQQECDGIICIGGDGLVHEVVNGLLTRSDATVARHIPISIIPAGTTNGLARSLGIHSTEDAVTRVLEGRARALDIIKVVPLDPINNTPMASPFYSVCYMDWGLTSQIEDSARSIKWMGALKKYVATTYALFTSLSVPTYAATLSFLPASPPSPTTPPAPCIRHEQYCETCAKPMQTIKGKRPHSDLKGWVVVDGKMDNLSFFVVGNTPRALTPNAHLSDGYVDLAIVERCSRADLARLLLRNRSPNTYAPTHLTPVNPGAQPSAPTETTPTTTTTTTPTTTTNEKGHVRYYKTSQFRLDVDSSIPLNIDGEVWELPDHNDTFKLQAEVHRGLCLVTC